MAGICLIVPGIFFVVFCFVVWVRLVLWAVGDGMVESYQCLLDVFQHGEVEFPLVIVPVKVNAEVSLAVTIMGYGVMLFEESHGGAAHALCPYI